MPDILSPQNLRLVGSLHRHFDLARTSAHLPLRRGIIHGAEYRRWLAALPHGPSHHAARGRLLSILGDEQGALKELGLATRRRDAPACAFAFRWELETGAGRDGGADLDRALAIEPENGWWRLWNAVRHLHRSPDGRALEEAAAAEALLRHEPYALFVRALIHYKRGEQAEALKALDAGLRAAPEVEWPYRLRGMCRHELGDSPGALKDALTAARLNEISGTFNIPLGIYRRRMDSRANIEAATNRIKKEPRAYWAYLYRADYRRSPDINENSAGLADLKRAVELAPESAIAWAYLARTQTALADFKGANESIEKAASLDPECGWIRAWKGEQRRRMGDIPAAAHELDEAVRLFPDYELAYAWRGGVRRAQGRAEDAVADLDIAVALKPVNIAWCYFERMNAKRALGWTGEALLDAEHTHRLNAKYSYESDPKKFGAALTELERYGKKARRDALADVWRGDILIRLRDFKNAERALARAVKTDPKNAHGRILRGRALGELGRWTAAFAEFKTAVRLEPEFPFGHAWLGRAKMVRGEYRAAVTDLARAASSEHGSAWILSWKGEAEFKLKDYAAAVRSLDEALELHKRYADALLWRGAALLRLNRLDAAAADLDAALEIRSDNSQARFFRGLLNAKTGRPLEAVDDLEEALASGEALSVSSAREARSLLKRVRRAASRLSTSDAVAEAERLQKEGQHAAAVDIYGRLLRLSPDSTDIYRKRAEAFRCLGRNDLALEDRSAIVRLLPADADALCGRGDIRRRLWDFSGGIKDARATLRLLPKSAHAWVLLSECQRNLGDYDAAIASATKAAAADPRWGWAFIVRAKAKRQKGDLDGALADTELAEKAGERAYAWGWRGEILRKAGKFAQALKELQRASADQPSNAWLLALRGELKRQLGDPSLGMDDFSRAVQLDPHASCDYDFLGATPKAVREDAALAWVFGWRGGIHRKEERLAPARADLDRAASLDPDCCWIRAWRGELLAHQGDAAGALKEFEQALRLFPRYAQARVWKGQALLSLGKSSPALVEFRRALSDEPQNVWALLGEASCLQKMGRARQAEDAVERARQLAPSLFAAPGGR